MTFSIPMTAQQTQTVLLLLAQAPSVELLDLREEIDSGRTNAHPEAFELLCAEVDRRGLDG